jgi:hypothetical protein
LGRKGYKYEGRNLVYVMYASRNKEGYVLIMVIFKVVECGVLWF